MKNRKGKLDQRAKFWREHLIRQQECGLSISQYCQQQGLALSSFSYWRARTKTKTKISKSLPLRSFAKVKLADFRESTMQFEVEIELGSRIKLRSSTWPPTDILRSYSEVIK